MSADRWGSNPQGIDENMVQRSAEVLLADWTSVHDGEGMTWENFAEQALRVLTAGLTDTRWEDR